MRWRIPSEAEPLLKSTASRRERRALAAYTRGTQRSDALAIASLRAIKGFRAKGAFARAMLLPSREFLAARASGGLVLIGRRHLRSNNSWMHNSQRLVKGRPRCTLLVHPSDAAARGLADGAVALLTSRVGAVEVPVEVTDSIMPGVVSLPHGWGHGRSGTRLSIASDHPGVSINDVTDEQFVDTLSGNAAVSGVPVENTSRAPSYP